MYTRKDQAKLSTAEWSRLTDALSQLHGTAAAPPAYREFVGTHVDAMTTMEGMSWGVHTMPSMGMVGRNFLAWHRWFLIKLERRLQQVHPDVTIPYWDWVKNPVIPAALSDPKLLKGWSVKRGTWRPQLLPSGKMVNAVLADGSFDAFQADLEAIHGGPHNAIGGDMGKARSPNDPLFWLHHANIDRLWAKWQASAKGHKPPNATETLQPKPLFGVKVSGVLDIAKLGYRYA